MNGFLWLGVASTLVLVLGIVAGGVFDVFDGLDVLDLDTGWLSLPVLAAFLGAFGFVTGALIDPLGPVALVVGVIAGVVLAYLAVRVSRAAMHMPTDATERAEDLLASFGRIVTSPSPGRLGQVLLQRPGGPLKVACSAETTIASGTEVVVVDVTSSTLVTVEPFDGGMSLNPSASPQLGDPS